MKYQYVTSEIKSIAFDMLARWGFFYALKFVWVK